MGAVALPIYIPLKVEGAGEAPTLLISIPPTWFPIISPPVLLQLIPLIRERNVDVLVVVVMATEPLAVFEPMVFPSPDKIPPILIPEPLVSIPIKTLADEAAVGTAETDMLAMVFPVIRETGKALAVVNKIPWKDKIPTEEYEAIVPEARAAFPPI